MRQSSLRSSIPPNHNLEDQLLESTKARKISVKSIANPIIGTSLMGIVESDDARLSHHLLIKQARDNGDVE